MREAKLRAIIREEIAALYLKVGRGGGADALVEGIETLHRMLPPAPQWHRTSDDS